MRDLNVEINPAGTDGASGPDLRARWSCGLTSRPPSRGALECNALGFFQAQAVSQALGSVPVDGAAQPAPDIADVVALNSVTNSVNPSSTVAVHSPTLTSTVSKVSTEMV
jgi:hypothetical protein